MKGGEGCMAQGQSCFICVYVLFFFLRNRLDLTLVTYQKERKKGRFVEIQKGGDICINSG